MKTKRSFWKWLVVWTRALIIKDIHEKRIIRENIETWNHYHRNFIKKCEREDATRLYKPSSDESSTVGFYGSDCGDGSDGGDGGAL